MINKPKPGQFVEQRTSEGNFLGIFISNKGPSLSMVCFGVDSLRAVPNAELFGTRRVSAEAAERLKEAAKPYLSGSAWKGW